VSRNGAKFRMSDLTFIMRSLNHIGLKKEARVPVDNRVRGLTSPAQKRANLGPHNLVRSRPVMTFRTFDIDSCDWRNPFLIQSFHRITQQEYQFYVLKKEAKTWL